MKRIFSVAIVLGLSGCGSSEDTPHPQHGLGEILTRQIVAEAPGCEIHSPDGKLINDRLKRDLNVDGDKVLIEAGSRINEHCFPAPE